MSTLEILLSTALFILAVLHIHTFITIKKNDNARTKKS